MNTRSQFEFGIKIKNDDKSNYESELILYHLLGTVIVVQILTTNIPSS